MTLAVTFRERLMQELAVRQAANPRYSMRALAMLLGTDHATLSQILRGKRQVPVDCIQPWARKLKLSLEETSVYAAVARIADEQARASHEALRQWAVEMMALLGQDVHREMLRLAREGGCKGDSRAVAAAVGVTVDDVNIALSRMLRLGLMEVDAGGIWKDKTSIGEITPQSFRRYVAERMPNPLAGTGG